MNRLTEAKKISQMVLDEYAEKITDDRLKALLLSLIEHLHGFAMENNLTEAEWMTAIQFLTRTGQLCDDHRQEFILLSDVIGLSSVVNAVEHDRDGQGTGNTVLGPFYVPGAPDVDYGGSVIRTEKPQGEVALVRGRVVDVNGNAISGATIETWSTDGNASYFVQNSDVPPYNMYGKLTSRNDGGYCFVTEMPISYAIPTDGTVGQLLSASNRADMRPAHIHFIVSASGYERLQTQLFSDRDSFLDADAVFAMREEVIVSFKDSQDPDLASEFGLPPEFSILDYDFVLVPGE